MVQERDTNIKISVELASKGFAETALRMFNNLTDPVVLDRVRLKSQFRGENENDDRKDEIEATRFVKLTVEMVSCRVWSLAQCTYCHPDCWAGVLDSNISAAQDAWSKIKNDAETIHSAWEALQEGGQQAGHTAAGRGTNGTHSLWSYFDSLVSDMFCLKIKSKKTNRDGISSEFSFFESMTYPFHATSVRGCSGFSMIFGFISSP